MSRLESNAEPSMEEILASIRKIIAEDSSGLRTPPPTKTGTPYTPAARSPSPSSSPTPQRGFMTREAFLKSSQPEPELRPSFAPAGSPRTLGSDIGSTPATSSLRLRDDLPAADAPSPSTRKTESPSAAPGAAKESAQALKPEKTFSPREEAISADETESVETVEILAIDEALPTIEAKSGDKLGRESDTASIEAQLTDLLSDDLNALERQVKAETATPANGTVSAEKAADAKPAAESDPFAFDLGPSPFAAKPEVPRPIVSAPVAEPAPPVAPPARPATFEPPRAASAPSFSERSEPAVGAPQGSPIGAGIAAAPPVANPQVDASSFKSRDSFAIPSVSATLGPARKLEPLSNAFGPAPPPPARAIETFSPPAESAYEAPRISQSAPPWETNRTSEPPPPPPFGRARVDDADLRSGLPAMPSDFLPDRPLEDAVADLLRPLLKTWLAENMPKIVERALRREMSERLLPGQKNPRD